MYRRELARCLHGFWKSHKELEIEVFVLHFSRTTDILADLICINHHITDEIDIKCSKTGYFSQRQLRIHPDAFRPSRNYTRLVKITYCDLSRLNFSFLEGFTQLNTLYIANSVKVHQAGWGSLKNLPNLSTLYIQRFRVNGWKTFPRLDNGLKKVVFCLGDVEDATMDRILHWLTSTFSETLQGLYLNSDSLTRFPVQIALFKQLEDAFLSSQAGYNIGISFLANGSYVRSESLRNLDLVKCGIKYIEPGAFLGEIKNIYGNRKKNNNSFLGDFSQVNLLLSQNLLTRFEKTTFLDILLQMANSTGHLSVFDSRFCRALRQTNFFN